MLAMVALLGTGSAARAQDLGDAVDYVAAAWSDENADGVAAITARSGVMLELENGPVGPLGPRQAAAALRRIFDGRATVSIRVVSARVVGDGSGRGFGEMEWTVRTVGTRIPETVRVFVAFLMEDSGWRVNQVRVQR